MEFSLYVTCTELQRKAYGRVLRLHDLDQIMKQINSVYI